MRTAHTTSNFIDLPMDSVELDERFVGRRYVKKEPTTFMLPSTPSTRIPKAYRSSYPAPRCSECKAPHGYHLRRCVHHLDSHQGLWNKVARFLLGNR